MQQANNTKNRNSNVSKTFLSALRMTLCLAFAFNFILLATSGTIRAAVLTNSPEQALPELLLLTTPDDALQLSWTLLSLSGLEKQTNQLQRPEQSSSTLTSSNAGFNLQNDCLLILEVSPTDKGSYFYAPFADGLSDKELEEVADAIPPVSFLFTTTDGTIVHDLQTIYPDGKLKYDTLTGMKLPVYDSNTNFGFKIQKKHLAQPLKLQISAIVCDGKSCLQFKKTFDLQVHTTVPRQILKADASLLNSLKIKLGDISATGIKKTDARQESHIQNQDQPVIPFENMAYKELLNTLTPRYFYENIEVSSLGSAMLLGLLAGFILNFMPCVLPVISLKLGTLVGLGGWKSLTLESEAGKHLRKRFRNYNIFFSLGVLIWFSILFAIIGGAGLMWGQFLQNQNILMFLTFLLFALSLSLFRIYNLPLLEVRIDERASLPHQAFLGGLLATVLATPCSGPLLGGVLGWAVNQPLPFLGATLGAVALGMASPFILMSIKPDLVRFLPQPGPWTFTLEKIMGFLLLGTVVYLLAMLPQEKTVTFLISMLVLSFSLWLWGRLQKNNSALLIKRFLLLGLMGTAIYLPFGQKIPVVHWQQFEPERFTELLGKHNLVVDFTADWCVNCRALEHTALADKNLADWDEKYKLTYIKVDLTSANPAGELLLNRLGSASIPVVAIFPAGKKSQQPLVLRDLFTTNQMEEALQESLHHK